MNWNGAVNLAKKYDDFDRLNTVGKNKTNAFLDHLENRELNGSIMAAFFSIMMVRTLADKVMLVDAYQITIRGLPCMGSLINNPNHLRVSKKRIRLS